MRQSIKCPQRTADDMPALHGARWHRPPGFELRAAVGRAAVLAVMTRARVLGIVLVVAVAFIWVASSELMQFIFGDNHYDKPYLLTSVSQSLFVLYLLPAASRRCRERLTGGALASAEPAATHPPPSDKGSAAALAEGAVPTTPPGRGAAAVTSLVVICAVLPVRAHRRRAGGRGAFHPDQVGGGAVHHRWGGAHLHHGCAAPRHEHFCRRCTVRRFGAAIRPADGADQEHARRRRAGRHHGLSGVARRLFNAALVAGPAHLAVDLSGDFPVARQPHGRPYRVERPDRHRAERLSVGALGAAHLATDRLAGLVAHHTAVGAGGHAVSTRPLHLAVRARPVRDDRRLHLGQFARPH
eukprot:ctg_609.g282